MRRCRKAAYLLILTVVLNILFCGCGEKKPDGLFNDIAWGTSYDEVKQAVTDTEGTAPEENTDGTKLTTTAENYDGVDGVSARTEYIFEDQKLSEVLVYLEFDENTYTNEEIMDKYNSILEESYGKCSKDNSEEKIWNLGLSVVHLANYYYGALVMDYVPTT